MSDSEWIREHISEYHKDEVPPCGTGEEGFYIFLALIGIAIVVIRFVLPFFGIEINIFG